VRRAAYSTGRFDQLALVRLAFFDGLSHAEVAEHLCQPLGTVKSWVRRALMVLKGCLERGASGDLARLARVDRQRGV